MAEGIEPMCRLNTIAFALTLAAFSSACESSPTEPTGSTTLTLAPGASGTFGTLTLTFIEVTADSRCPGDALCISPGDAQVAIATRLPGLGPSLAAELHLNEPSKRSTERGDYKVTFEALAPYPFLSLGPISPGAYRATFRIERK